MTQVKGTDNRYYEVMFVGDATGNFLDVAPIIDKTNPEIAGALRHIEAKYGDTASASFNGYFALVS